MLRDFYIPKLSNDMKIAVQKNHLRGQILYPVKNGVDVFLIFFSRFLVQNIRRHQVDTNTTFMYDASLVGKSENIMDQWILSYSQSLIKSVKYEMEAYNLNRVVPKLLKFVEQLTNWYVKFNKKRLKGDTGPEDCVHALTTLYTGKICIS